MTSTDPTHAGLWPRTRIAKHLKAARLKYGWTVDGFARHLGISTRYVRMLETGRFNLTLRLGTKWAYACDVSLDALVVPPHPKKKGY